MAIFYVCFVKFCALKRHLYATIQHLSHTYAMFKNYPFFCTFRSAGICLAIFLTANSAARAQTNRTLAERLGYPAGTKLLILHADDLAVAHTENQASFKALETGSVTSASIMAPCPWLPEVAAFAKANPGADLGMHLTLTSEWKYLKWGPVAPRNQVSSLLDSLGYFYDNCGDLNAHAKPEEIETELRAQINKAIAMGIAPTHLDSHMGCLFFTTPTLFDIYLKLGRDYRIPAMVSRDMLDQLPEPFRKSITEQDIVLDHVITATPEDFKGGMPAYYERVFRSLEPGVSVILMHLAQNDGEMQGVAADHPDWGAEWRQADFDFFISDNCRKILKEQGIKLITWREVGKLLAP